MAKLGRVNKLCFTLVSGKWRFVAKMVVAVVDFVELYEVVLSKLIFIRRTLNLLNSLHCIKRC